MAGKAYFVGDFRLGRIFVRQCVVMMVVGASSEGPRSNYMFQNLQNLIFDLHLIV